ncbi:unnamed protein product [Nippostrongylus brasiliensis]|uniref:DUF4477 domain-containing protein n=1 Tax=Nippostrongylus brasiliensis TaxID=27835 RepID=A0A0N4Y2T2_NIPBR|nr:unnamed protein product [Nippostrongylus brasiliensis]
MGNCISEDAQKGHKDFLKNVKSDPEKQVFSFLKVEGDVPLAKASTHFKARMRMLFSSLYSLVYKIMQTPIMRKRCDEVKGLAAQVQQWVQVLDRNILLSRLDITRIIVDLLNGCETSSSLRLRDQGASGKAKRLVCRQIAFILIATIPLWISALLAILFLKALTLLLLTKWYGAVHLLAKSQCMAFSLFRTLELAQRMSYATLSRSLRQFYIICLKILHIIRKQLLEDMLTLQKKVYIKAGGRVLLDRDGDSSPRPLNYAEVGVGTEPERVPSRCSSIGQRGDVENGAVNYTLIDAERTQALQAANGERRRNPTGH